ncbi:MAG: hypothetical protein QW815_03725 [Nitrososphaerota archaeon]
MMYSVLVEVEEESLLERMTLITRLIDRQKGGVGEMVDVPKNVEEYCLTNRCHRCGGLMVQEKVIELGLFDWRCVSCGERIDPVILAHRQAARSKSLLREAAEKLFDPRKSDFN